jgi:hypothetical protein
MPNLAWTYNSLRAALQSWPVNASTQYVADLDSIIGLGELRLVRDLNLEIFDRISVAASTVIGTRTIAKPTDAVILRTVALTVAGAYTPIERRSHDYCKLYAPDPTVQGIPLYWCDLNSTQILLVPTPSAVYATDIRYVARPADSLASGSPTASSWLATNVPDCLFAACLMEADHYIKADDRYADMKTKYYEELLPSARAELRQMIREGDYSPFKPAAKAAE